MPQHTPDLDVEKAYEYIKASEGISNKELFKLLDLHPHNPRVKALRADDRLFCQKGQHLTWFTKVYADANNTPEFIRGARYQERQKADQKRADRKSRAGPASATGLGDVISTVIASREVRLLDRIMIPTH